MSTEALERFNPAALAAIIGTEAIQEVNDPFASGISAGDFLPQISIRGNRIRLKINGEETVLKENSIGVYLVTSRPNVSKVLYVDGYDGTEKKAPDCSSADGTYPDSNIKTPVHSNCQTCPNNAWGSKVSKNTGKQSKACSDYKLVVVALVAQPEYAFALRIPAASLKPFAAYISKLNLAGVPANAAKTRISLGDTEYPSLEFDFDGTVDTREAFETLKALAESSDVLNAVKIQARVAAPTSEPATAVQPVVVEPVGARGFEAVTPAVAAEPAQAEAEAPSLQELLGKPKATPKTTKKKAEAPAPEPVAVAEPPAETADEEPITSLDALLGKLNKG